MSLLDSVHHLSSLSVHTCVGLNVLSTALAFPLMWSGKKIALSVQEEGTKKTVAKTAGYSLMTLGLIVATVSSGGLAVFTATELNSVKPGHPALSFAGGCLLGVTALASTSFYFIKNLNALDRASEDSSFPDSSDEEINLSHKR